MRPYVPNRSGVLTVGFFLGLLGLPLGGAAQTPLQGWVDLHTHPLANLGFAGKFFYGGIDVGSMLPADPNCNQTRLQQNPPVIVRAGSEQQALGNDNSTHGGWNMFNNGCGDDLRKQVIHAFQSQLSANDPPDGSDGYPDFQYWPSWNDVTHQRMWVEWLRRAYKGGLRVMVALAVNNKTFADITAGSGDSPDDDQASADLQVGETIAFVGRHSDFMQVAYSSADVASIVSSGRMAVIIGAEIDHIGNFGVTGAPTPSEIQVRDEIDRLYAEGVRYLFPIHVLDNAFGGTATYIWLFNTSNLRESGHPWNLTCSAPQDQITTQMSASSSFSLQVMMLLKWGPSGVINVPNPPQCPPNLGHRNAMGLTALGAAAINEMMRLGMLIDIDHMSQASTDATLALAEGVPGGYPLNSGHNGVRDPTAGPTNERSLTPLQYQRIGRLHGMAGVGSAKLDAWQWLTLYQKVLSAIGPGAVAGFGTDANGLEFAMPPRTTQYSGVQPVNVQYADPPGCGTFSNPGCTSPPGWTQPPNTLPAPRDGNRIWNYNSDGVVHYGMMADFVADVASLPGGTAVVANLNQGAEYFYETWRKGETLSRGIFTSWLPSGWLGWQQVVGVSFGQSGPIPVKQIATYRNADGRLEVVYIAPNSALYHTWQVTPEGGWWSPMPLGGSPANNLAMGRNADGRLQIFYTGPGNAIFTNSQLTRGGSWGGEVPMGGAALQITVGQNADGRFELFVVGTDNRLYHNAQVQASGSAWSGWSPLGGSTATQVAVASNADGRLEVFYNGPNNTIYTNTQVSPGGKWTGETSMGGGALQFSVQQNKVGGLEVFIVGTDHAGWRNVQSGPNGPWGGWGSFGGWLSQLSTGRNSDGRLEVFCMGVNNALYHNVQTTPASPAAPDGTWSGWQAFSGAAQQIATGVNADGRLDVFVVGTDNLLYHNMESP